MSTTEDREAAFIGRITAGATHELRNILAIVKESAGLIEDIIVASDRSGSPNADRLLRTVDRIKAQVERGAELLTSLNRFAHSLDHAADKIDLNQAAQQVSFLCQRDARRGRQQVQAQLGDEGLPVVVNLLRLQMAIYTAVECCLEQLPEGGTLYLCAARHGVRPSLEFNAEAGGEAVLLAPTEAAAWSRLAEVLNDLGASVERVEAAQGFRLILSG